MPRTAHAQSSTIEIIAVEPGLSETGLVCRIRTRGLPGAPSLETLESGLPSAIVFSLSLLDRSGRDRGGSRIEVRMEPDLWDGTLILRTPTRDLRLVSVNELGDSLRALGPFPVSGSDFRTLEMPLRVRVRLAIHPLARTEVKRVHAMFGTEVSEKNPDRREASTGLGTLLSFFLRRQPGDQWVDEETSSPFTPDGLK